MRLFLLIVVLGMLAIPHTNAQFRVPPLQHGEGSGLPFSLDDQDFEVNATSQGPGLRNAPAAMRVGVVAVPGAEQEPRGLKNLLIKIPFVSNIEVRYETVAVDLRDRQKLAELPILYLRGIGPLTGLDQLQRENLRRYLNAGGFILADDATGSYRSAFAESTRALLGSLFPSIPLTKIGKGHVLYQSYYLLDYPAGRVIERPYLDGLVLGTRVAFLINYNDLCGALEKDLMGKYLRQVSPGGDRQRALAQRLGVNIFFYALTLDYKADAVHIPEILKRRKLGKARYEQAP